MNFLAKEKSGVFCLQKRKCSTINYSRTVPFKHWLILQSITLNRIETLS